MDDGQATVTGNDNVLVSSTIQIVANPPIANVSGFDGVTNPSRLTQQGVSPTTIQSRALGNLFSVYPSDASRFIVASYANLGPASSVNFLFTVVDPSGRQIIAIPEVTFEVNGTAFPNNVYGFGTTPVFVYNDLQLSDGKNLVVRAALRNNDGINGINLVRCFARFRIIANPGTPTVTNGSGTSTSFKTAGSGGGVF